MLIVLSISAAFIVSIVTVKYLSDPLSKIYIVDHPNERSLHITPTPRTGGLAILSGMIIGTLGIVVAGKLEIAWYALIGMVLIALVSFIDDRKNLGSFPRILAQAIAAGLLLASGLLLDSVRVPGGILNWPIWVAGPVLFLLIVWLVNLYNFMDGIDGLAGGMAVIGFGCFALFGWFADHITFMALSLIVAFSVAGFLIFNFPPARIFMGDVGSSTLGFLVAWFALWAERDGILPLWATIIVFSPFIIDATATLVVRLLRREEVWKAHKMHYYQRLVQLGWGHKKTVLWEYGLMLFCAGSAIIIVRFGVIEQLSVILGWIVIYIMMIRMVSLLEKKKIGRQKE